MSIEFWFSFIINNLIYEHKKLNNMNILKSIFVGVGAVMWSPRTNMTYEVENNFSSCQDNSKGVRVPLSTPSLFD